MRGACSERGAGGAARNDAGSAARRAVDSVASVGSERGAGSAGRSGCNSPAIVEKLVEPFGATSVDDPSDLLAGEAGAELLERFLYWTPVADGDVRPLGAVAVAHQRTGGSRSRSRGLLPPYQGTALGARTVIWRGARPKADLLSKSPPSLLSRWQLGRSRLLAAYDGHEFDELDGRDLWVCWHGQFAHFDTFRGRQRRRRRL